jgi:hypothetical protein
MLSLTMRTARPVRGPVARASVPAPCARALSRGVARAAVETEAKTEAKKAEKGARSRRGGARRPKPSLVQAR